MMMLKSMPMPNGKYYVEIQWGKRDIANIDVVRPNAADAVNEAARILSFLIREKVFSFLSWRKNSLLMAERQIWPETREAIDGMYACVSRLNMVANMDVVVRTVLQMEVYVLALKPKTDNYLWDDLQCLGKWANEMQRRREAALN